MDNWISVKDRLPEKERQTDVYTDCICGGKGFVAKDVVYYHYDEKFFYNHDTAHSGPIPATHWMPTPKPPKQLK